MSWSILKRLVVGYLSIFLLVIAMSLYAIVRIGEFNEVTQSVLRTNNRIMEDAGKLSDTLLSLIRYERKFIITKDPAFHQQFVKLRSDFDRYLEELSSITAPSDTKDFIVQIRSAYGEYQALLSQELEQLRAGRNYPQQWYQEAKERVSDTILEDLDQLKTHVQKDTNGKIEGLYEAGTSARRMAIGMTAAFLILGMTLSFFINRSITRPISVLKKKTGEIARGLFKADLNLSSPPEIGELANAFNLMCQKLNELDRMKADFFSSVSHEFRTPLSTIKMGISLLQDEVEGPLTERQKSLLAILGQESNRLIELVNSLLDLSKMEAGMMVYQMEERNLLPLIEQAVQEIGPLVEAKKIHLETETAENLPLVKVDSERILQVLRNLLGNAVKFTPEGGQVKVRVQPMDRGVAVSVSDTGPGIPPESLSTIFEKFQQVPSQSSRGPKGTGLGLAIANQIVTHHGGRIWAESEPGNGSTFVFVLPA